jgi:hypothetical protein
MRVFPPRRAGALAVAGMALSAVLVPAVLVPAVAQAQPEACTWRVTAIVPPDRFEERLTHVTGTNSAGDYSGYISFGGSDNQLVLWTGGRGEVQPSPENVESLWPVDENAAGTVLVNTRLTPSGPTTAYLYTGGHRGAGTYHALPLPVGYESATGVAINSRGDVVGRVRSPHGTRDEVAIWPVFGSGPIVLDLPQLPAPAPVDVDDDGTVLIGGGYDAHLWRDGRLITLAATSVLTRAISNGKAVGSQLASPESRAVQWTSTGVDYFERGVIAEDINRTGLVVGTIDSWNGPAAVWQGTRLLGALPLPRGGESVVYHVVGDDNVVYGYVQPNIGPVRWDCV